MDFLAISALVRKIYRSFDFDGDGKLDRVESSALLNTLVREIASNDTTLSLNALKDMFKQQ